MCRLGEHEADLKMRWACGAGDGDVNIIGLQLLIVCQSMKTMLWFRQVCITAILVSFFF